VIGLGQSLFKMEIRARSGQLPDDFLSFCIFDVEKSNIDRC
jgi:hypothetical protein